jgi:hypothetical protein
MTESKNTKRAVDPSDPSQTSLTLNSAVNSTGFQKDGQDNITSPGQGLFSVPPSPLKIERELISPNPAASRTSSNNFINFCMTVDKPLTNGQQIQGTCVAPLIALGYSVDLSKSLGGSCNTAPIGVLPSVDNMPSAKFIFPPNFAAVTKGETFTVQLAISHLETGWFTNPQTTYMAAPVEVNASGDVIGHSHIVIEQVTGFGQTTPTDPKSFAFFKALNSAAVDGVLSTDVTGGLPAGYYRITAFHTAANHQPSAYTPSLVL